MSQEVSLIGGYWRKCCLRIEIPANREIKKLRMMMFVFIDTKFYSVH